MNEKKSINQFTKQLIEKLKDKVFFFVIIN